MKTVLVVGATGRFVVQMLLDGGHTAKVVVRSKSRMMGLLKDEDYGERLWVKEAAILDVPETELKDIVSGCDAIVSCLGHREIYAEPKRLVTEATTCLTRAAGTAKTRFILMSSNGVANPNGKDDIRPFMERCLLALIRYLVPPHADNEEAAYLHALGTKGVEWSVLRPDDLIDAEVSPYNLLEKPKKGLFGGGTATRANVAHAMISLVENDELWNRWKYQMPVLDNKEA